MENKQTELMGKAPVSKAILKLSIPVVCGMMVQVLYNLVDTFFIGRLNDQNQLAAASITTPVFMILMAIATIISTGAASYISRCLGQKDHKSANQTLTTGLAICTVLAVVVMAAGLIFVKPLITALGASPAVYPYAYQYVVVMLVGAIPVMLSFAGGQLLRSEGAAMPSIIGMMIGTVVNVILDPIFIFALNMGILGAGIATVLGNVAALVYYIWYYLSGKSLLQVKLKYVSMDRTIWKEIFLIGIPACVSQLLSSVALIVLNNQAKSYGDTVLAGMGISSKLMFIGTFIFMGFAAGCQPLVGYNYGAKNFKRVRQIFKTGMMMTFGIGVVLTVIFWVCANVLVSFFTPLSEVVVQGAQVFRISIFSFVILGPQMLATTGIQAFGKAKESLVLSVARQGFVYIPLLFVMQNSFGLNGLIWAQPMADTVTLGIGLIFLSLILKQCTKDQTETSHIESSPNSLVITINREYGSGGREIGERVAQSLGIPFYDKKIIDQTATEMGLDSEHIAQVEESLGGQNLYSLATSAYYAGSVFGYSGTPEADRIFAAQSKVIQELASQGSCVIVGRCACNVLKNTVPCVNVFISAPFEKRCERAIHEYCLPAADAVEIVKCNDAVRDAYFEHYTGAKRNDSNNYDLILCTADADLNVCVEKICNAFTQANKLD